MWDLMFWIVFAAGAVSITTTTATAAFVLYILLRSDDPKAEVVNHAG